LENKNKDNKEKKITFFFFWKFARKVAGGGRSWVAVGGGWRLAAAAGGWRWLEVAAGPKRLGLRLVLRAL
jgi:hypothetical protein